MVHGRASVESFKARRDSDTHSGYRDPGSRKTEPLVTETVAQAIDLSSRASSLFSCLTARGLAVLWIYFNNLDDKSSSSGTP